MGFIEDLFGKKPQEINIEDLNTLIINKVEENKCLEYKSPEILDNKEKLSEWVSAFLNAEGGLIILGMQEDKQKFEDKTKQRIWPTSIKYLGVEYTKERIDQLVYSNISSTIKPKIEIYPVRNNNNPEQSVYLLDIPKGDYPPYQAANKKYYRRLNVTKYAMAHYEIADFFGARRKPIVELEFFIIDVKSDFTFTINVFIRNNGAGTAKHVNVLLSFANAQIIHVLTGPKERIDDIANLPTLQYQDPDQIFYSNGILALQIWQLRMKVIDRSNNFCFMWKSYAEDQDQISRIVEIMPNSLLEAGVAIAKGHKTVGIKDDGKLYYRKIDGSK